MLFPDLQFCRSFWNGSFNQFQYSSTKYPAFMQHSSQLKNILALLSNAVDNFCTNLTFSPINELYSLSSQNFIVIAVSNRLTITSKKFGIGESGFHFSISIRLSARHSYWFQYTVEYLYHRSTHCKNHPKVLGYRHLSFSKNIFLWNLKILGTFFFIFPLDSHSIVKTVFGSFDMYVYTFWLIKNPSMIGRQINIA